MLERMLSLVETAEEQIQKDLTKGTDVLPTNPPQPEKIFNTVEEAVKDFVTKANREVEKVSIKSEPIPNTDDKKLYRFTVNAKDDEDEHEFNRAMTRFLASTAFRLFKKVLGMMHVVPTQLHLLSSIERWNIDRTASPKLTYTIEVDLTVQK